MREFFALPVLIDFSLATTPKKENPTGQKRGKDLYKGNLFLRAEALRWGQDALTPFTMKNIKAKYT